MAIFWPSRHVATSFFVIHSGPKWRWCVSALAPWNLANFSTLWGRNWKKFGSFYDPKGQNYIKSRIRKHYSALWLLNLINLFDTNFLHSEFQNQIFVNICGANIGVFWCYDIVFALVYVQLESSVFKGQNDSVSILASMEKGK